MLRATLSHFLFALLLICACRTAAGAPAHGAPASIGQRLDWTVYDKDAQTLKLTLGVHRARVDIRHLSRDGDNFRITISNGKSRSTFDIENVATFGSAQLVELDPGNSEPEVLLNFFSGGAHCCYSLELYKFESGRWNNVPFQGPQAPTGSGDGDGDNVEDIDHDGVAEMIERDDAFLYKFDSYAGSYSPARIYALRDGHWTDVSSRPAYRSMYVHSAKEMAKACKSESNSFWAAYAAEQAIIGNLKSGWATVLKCYGRQEDWGLCVDSSELDHCTSGKRAFPDVLKELLQETGYWKLGYKSQAKSNNNCREFPFPSEGGGVVRRRGPNCGGLQ
jgi:hypothetical protein